MAILWCGGEDVDFPNGATPTVDTGSTHRRSSYSREALNINSASFIKSTLFPGGAVTTAWLTAQCYCTSTSATSYRAVGFGRSGASVGALMVGSSSSSATKLALWKYDGTTWTQLATESGTSITGALHRFDIQVTSYGASATVNVYFDGVLAVTYSGDVTVSGVTNLDSVWFMGNAATGWSFSEFIVADEDTRLFSLATLAPSAAGDANAWTGAYTDIDETTINDADEIYTNAAGNDAQVNVTDLPTGTFTVRAVKIAARCAASAGATATKVALGVKSGGTIDPGSNQTLSTSWATYERLMSTNPVTTNNWASSEINALQLNFRSAS